MLIFLTRRVPWTTDDPKACGLPQDYNASKEWADKKVVLVAVPGMLSISCLCSPMCILLLDPLSA